MTVVSSKKNVNFIEYPYRYELTKESKGSLLKDTQLNMNILNPNVDSELDILDKKVSRSGTFIDNMRLPVHRWFRYSAGFSAEWVKEIIKGSKYGIKSKVLDPFAGSGTTLLASESIGAESYGFENHPFISRIARAKLLWYLDVNKLNLYADKLLKSAKVNVNGTDLYDNKLLNKCYSEENLSKLDALKKQYISMSENDLIWELIWLAITSILRETSGAGTAQWQYVLPNKQKSKVLDPFESFYYKIRLISNDMLYVQNKRYLSNAKLYQVDSRELSDIQNYDPVDLIITSPPYPNNYDYADATRLELTFWGEVAGWGDLQNVIRQYLIRSCSQHTAAERLSLDSLLDDNHISSIKDEITSVCKNLAEIRETKGGRKSYHTMVAAYFIDLSKIWIKLRSLCKTNSKLCYVIGDSAPYGVYVPVDEWLGKLALSAGFKSYKFDKIRDRNIKWKNRKHRVPLKEGHLWIEG